MDNPTPRPAPTTPAYIEKQFDAGATTDEGISAWLQTVDGARVKM
jgi:hypothetical protein